MNRLFAPARLGVRATARPVVRIVVRLVGPALITVLGGCATAPAADEMVIDLPAMHLESIELGGTRRVEILDPESLFRSAGEAFTAEDYPLAADRYLLIVKRFPDGRFAWVSRYNGALALARDGRCAEAIPHFDAVADGLAKSRDAQDALLQAAICHEGLASWAAAAKALDRILAPEFARISPLHRVEAHTRRGVARRALGDVALAERDFLAAIRLYRKHAHTGAVSSSPFGSQAQFQIGEIYRGLFRTIRFRLPLDQMARDLDEKSNYFLKAQKAYLRAIRLHHSEFATRAGYHLGGLYEAMYEDMLAAEIPEELTEEEVEIYYEELRGHIRPLVVKAINIYERNVRMAERAGKNDEWLQASEAGLARLKEVLRREASREVEQQLEAQ